MWRKLVWVRSISKHIETFFPQPSWGWVFVFNLRSVCALCTPRRPWCRLLPVAHAQAALPIGSACISNPLQLSSGGLRIRGQLLLRFSICRLALCQLRLARRGRLESGIGGCCAAREHDDAGATQIATSEHGACSCGGTKGTMANDGGSATQPSSTWCGNPSYVLGVKVTPARLVAPRKKVYCTGGSYNTAKLGNQKRETPTSILAFEKSADRR